MPGNCKIRTVLQAALRSWAVFSGRQSSYTCGMSSRAFATANVAFGVVLAAVSASPAFAQTAENVMVVINEASPESVRIGEYYVAKRNIPPENVTRLKTAVADELDRAAYEFFIEVPISQTLTRHGTQDRIHYIVLTKGIPLRVRGTDGVGAMGR